MKSAFFAQLDYSRVVRDPQILIRLAPQGQQSNRFPPDPVNLSPSNGRSR